MTRLLFSFQMFGGPAATEVKVTVGSLRFCGWMTVCLMSLDIILLNLLQAVDGLKETTAGVAIYCLVAVSLLWNAALLGVISTRMPCRITNS